MSRRVSCIHFLEGNRCNLLRGPISEWDAEHCAKFYYDSGTSEMVLQQVPVPRD